MNILILNGSPHKNGNTVAMTAAFTKGATEIGNKVKEMHVAHMNIKGCLGCEYCHKEGNGTCVQNDDMKEVYKELTWADILILASPIYYFTLSGQLQCAIHRTYAVGTPSNIKKTGLLLSSGSDGVFDASIDQYHKIFTDWMKIEDAGIITAHGSENKSFDKLQEIYEFGKLLK